MSSDHAGGLTSPVVSDALASARDGIIGYWKPDDQDVPSPVAVLENFLDLEYLLPENRALLFDTALIRGVTVAGVFADEKNDKPVCERKTSAATLKIDGADILTIERPSQGAFQKQLDHVRTHADLRADRLNEIQVQIDDILSFFGAIHYLDPEFRNYTQELLEAAVRFCISVEMQIKHYCRSARPVHYSTKVQPLIQTPDHSTFPSGHSTEAFTVAALLYRLANGPSASDGLDVGGTDPVFRMAERIAANRVVAGVHFPVDSAAGALLGLTLADHIVSLGTGQTTTKVEKVTFRTVKKEDGAVEDDRPDSIQTFDQEDNFGLPWLDKAQPTQSPGVKEESCEFQKLWQKANEEWRR